MFDLVTYRGRARVLLASAGALFASAPSALADPDPWADNVVSYDQGSNPGVGFTDPTTALGEPTRNTNLASPFGGAVTPFQSPFGTDEIVSIGEGGQLTVSFDEPIADDAANPFGIDLLVFGNAFFFIDPFPDGVANGLGSEGGIIELSANGSDYFTVTGVDADGLYPTNGFNDPSAAFTTGGVTATGTVPSDFTLPVDPSFNATGKSLSEIVAGYNGSGGGVGIDIASVGLSEVSFIRISNPLESGVTPEIDGFADVAVPEPGSAVLLALAGGVLLRRRKG
ncbi:MAG: PEP-CTERM sorting domain-containing protein [Planctomycetota bacterium]